MSTLPANRTTGFTILEVTIGMGILVIVSTAIYLAYANTIEIVSSGQYHSAASSIIESEIEIIRNMRYEDIGIDGGVPTGKLAAEKTVVLDSSSFVVQIFVRNIDDPFDGLLGGSPPDLDPADYKLVEVHVVCDSCARFSDVSMTTTIAPRNLESPELYGNLIIQSLDALGQPLPDATVTVSNTSVAPAINLTDTTDNEGRLNLVGVPSSSAGYQIVVTKNGYSTERTYPPDEPSNPNPTKPDVTVAEEQLSFATFSIDQTSSLNLSVVDTLCAPISGLDLLITGAKLIGTAPDVPKYSVAHTTDGTGLLSLSGLEWDTYNIAPTDTSYAIAGTSLSSPVTLDPTDSVSLSWVAVPKIVNGLLVTVIDDSGNPVNDALIRLSSGSYDQTLISGYYPWSQADWSGGQYAAASGVHTASSGTLLLEETGGTYPSGSYAWLESQTINLGSTTTFSSLDWSPSSQPAETGTDSIRFQVAANNDLSTWTYVGPDGTPGSYFITPGSPIPSMLSGNQYLRYRVELRTLDEYFTPSLNSVSIHYRSTCLPGGAAFFSGLTSDTYDLSVTNTSFQDFGATDISGLADWQEHVITLSP